MDVEFSIIQPHRIWVKEGMVWYMKANEKMVSFVHSSWKVVYLFLFNDLLLLTQPLLNYQEKNVNLKITYTDDEKQRKVKFAVIEMFQIEKLEALSKDAIVGEDLVDHSFILKYQTPQGPKSFIFCTGNLSLV